MVKKVWDDPEIYRIFVDLPQNPLRLLNVYVIRSQGANLVIDTGFNRPECEQALWSGIRELGLDLSKTALFLTHLHTDHTGLVWSFVEQQVPVYMSRIDYTLMQYPKNGNRPGAAIETRFRKEDFPPEELARQETENQARHYAPRPGFPVIPVDDGQTIPVGGVEVRAVHTPGHTPGHMVLYLPEQLLLFSGDHVLFDITPNIGVWGWEDRSLETYIASLKTVDALPVQATFPAHRETGADLHGRILELIDHHGWRLNEIYEAVKAHPGATAYELAGRITWSARGLSWAQFPPHQKWFALSETLSHLDYLTSRDQIVRVEEGDFLRYYPGGEEADNEITKM